MIIPRKAFLNKISFFNKNNMKLISFFTNAVFTKNGRTALISSMQDINVASGSTILIPSFICESVTKELKLNGYKIKFIDISKELTLSFDKIMNLYNKEPFEVIVLVDYFGFLAEYNITLAKKLKKMEINIIIDRCHSFSLDRNINSDLTYVDSIIYSLRKTFNVIDGGLYFVKSKKNILPKKNIFSVAILFFLVKTIAEEILVKFGFINIYSEIFEKFKGLNKLRLNSQKKEYLKKSKINFLLFNLLSNSTNIHKVKEARVKNYNKLLEEIKCLRIKTLFSEIDSTTCPQVLPILDETKSLHDFFIKNKIGSYKWPAGEMSEEIINDNLNFPNSISKNNELVCLPIHQSINMKHMSKVLKVIKKWKKIYSYN